MSTWMIVEDEPDITEVLLAMFEIWNVQSVSFADGQEAIEWVDAVDAGKVHGELPSLALLDIRLPGADGTEVAARLRRSPRLGNIGIVMITAYRLSPAKEQDVMAASGADRLLYKPLPVMGELKAIFDEVLAKRSR